MSRLSREGRWGASEARCPVARRGLNESGMRWRKDLQPAPAAKSTTASARQMPLSLPVRPDFSAYDRTTFNCPAGHLQPPQLERHQQQAHIPGRQCVVARSEEHTSELKSLMRSSYAAFY